MTLEEIKQLEHLIVEEQEYNIILTPEYGYYIEVEDVPENHIYYESVEMLRQPEYSRMWIVDACPECHQDSSI